MRKYFWFCRKIAVMLMASFIVTTLAVHASPPPKQEFYQIKIYILKNRTQESKMDKYLKDA